MATIRVTIAGIRKRAEANPCPDMTTTIVLGFDFADRKNGIVSVKS
jgi:hypothetical protein